jgi:ketosteroid isomerase-like protein
MVFLVSTPALLAKSKDELAIRALLDKYKEAGNSTDDALVTRLLTEISPTGGPFYTAFGDISRSVTDLKNKIELHLQTLASRSFSITTPLHIQIDDKMAWTSYNWKAEEVHNDESQHFLKGRETLVFAKQGTYWKLRHLHTSLPTSIPSAKVPIQVDVRTMLDEEHAIWSALRDEQIGTVEVSPDENDSVLQDDLAYRIQGKETYLSSVRDWVLQNELRSFWLVEPELDIFEDTVLLTDYYFRLLDPKLEILGDTALLTYYYDSSGFSDSGPFSNSGKVTSVYGRRDGKWLALHQHNTLNENDPITYEKQIDY